MTSLPAVEPPIVDRRYRLACMACPFVEYRAERPRYVIACPRCFSPNTGGLRVYDRIAEAPTKWEFAQCHSQEPKP